jgi:dephospho-CoA kinase
MNFLVLGLTGKRGAGKDTAAKYLKSKYGFRILTYTDDVLAPLLKKLGKKVTRENLIRLALQLRRREGKEILTKMISARITRPGFWAISGVRYPEETEYFRECFGEDFTLIYIECSARKRYQRVKKRGTKGEGRLTFREFMKIEGRETEKVIGLNARFAECRISNEGSFFQLYRQIDTLAKELGLARKK